MTLLSIAQDAARRLGLDAPVSLVGNANETAVRLLALINQAATELRRRHNWTALTKEKTFTTVAAETQTDSPIATDFDRFVDGSAWNRSAQRRLKGPLTADEWQSYKGSTTPAILDAFRVRGGSFMMLPAPSAGQTVAYEYVSSFHVDADPADGIADRAQFTHDTDVSLLDEEMITADAVWRYKRSTGLSYAEDHRTAQVVFLDRVSRDGGRRVVDLGDYRSSRPGIVIPEGSWPL